MATETAKPHILIADDYPSILDMLWLTFLRAGFSVTVTQDGQEALEAFRESLENPHPDKGAVDFVLLDCFMPKKNGFDTAVEIRSLSDHIPIAFITAYRDAISRQKTEQLGAVGLWEKPFDLEVVVAAVRAAIKERQAARVTL